MGEVWRSASRIESGLKGETDNPIRDWLASPAKRGSVRRRMQKVQLQLDALTSARCEQLGVESETKAFITGRIKPGGGPSHYDSYDNLALVLSGSKVFYHAPPRALAQVPFLCPLTALAPRPFAPLARGRSQGRESVTGDQKSPVEYVQNVYKSRREQRCARAWGLARIAQHVHSPSPDRVTRRGSTCPG